MADQLPNAMRSRAVIEQAKGILMGNRKLRDVAQALVDHATGNSSDR